VAKKTDLHYTLNGRKEEQCGRISTSYTARGAGQSRKRPLMSGKEGRGSGRAKMILECGKMGQARDLQRKRTAKGNVHITSARKKYLHYPRGGDT